MSYETHGSSFFKCRSCGYTTRILTPYDTAHCSQCGGTMDRCRGHRKSVLAYVKDSYRN